MSNECQLETIPYIPLMMSHSCLADTPELPLPLGYTLRLFQSGEDALWAAVVVSAGEFDCVDEALAYFNQHFGQEYRKLGDRCVFLLDASGAVAGTATGWFSDEDPSVGRLHWVAIGKAHQGRGLCKPMVSATMLLMRQLGHEKAILTTQPGSWKGIKVYLDLGWEPYNDGLAEYHKGWSIVEDLTGRKLL